MNKPSIFRSAKRGIISAIAFLIPLIFAHFPEWGNITLGAVLTAILHYAEKALL